MSSSPWITLLIAVALHGVTACDSGGSSPDGDLVPRVAVDRVTSPEEVAVDGSAVYWTSDPADYSGGLLRKSLADDSAPEMLAEGSLGLRSLLVGEDSYLYWIEATRPPAIEIYLARIPTTGGEPQVLVDDPLVEDLVLDGPDLYWCASTDGPGVIRRMAAEGGAVTEILSYGTLPVALFVSGDDVVWADAPAREILLASKDGSGTPTVLATGQVYPNDVWADSSHVYWTNSTADPGTGEVVRAARSGEGTPEVLASGLDYTVSLTGNESSVLWANEGVGAAGSVMRYDKASGRVDTLAPDQDSPRDVFLFGNDLYWTNGGFAGGGYGSIMVMSL